METIDIGSKQPYPANSLSNFTAHEFFMDGVRCASMEGFLQSLKTSDLTEQRRICGLVGFDAKKAGRGFDWKRNQVLYWAGQAFARNGKAYQQLLDDSFSALSLNQEFSKALIATGTAMLIHSIGNTNQTETVLTEYEFCARLATLRDCLRKEWRGCIGISFAIPR